VTAKREEIHRKYLDILSKMAHLYEKQGRFKKAIVYNKKLIQADPSLEAAYRSLMILYANRGMRTEALRTYEACCKALHRYLDAKPDELTTALFKKMHEASNRGNLSDSQPD
jgi:LuxR family maltose regulon positive regulatory protein